MEEESDGVPLQFRCRLACTSIQFHPTSNLIVTSHVYGRIRIFSYSPGEKLVPLSTSTYHSDSVTCFSFFNQNPHDIVSCSCDGSISIIDTETGQKKLSIDSESQAPVSAVDALSHDIFITGHEDGYIKLWDARKDNQSLVNSLSVSPESDTVRSICLSSNDNTLVCCTSDGYLSAVRTKKMKLIDRSDEQMYEFSSCHFVKNNTKVICASVCDSCELAIFNVDEWGNPSDCLTSDMSTIEAVCPVSDDLVLLGSMDGKIRLFNVLPNRVISGFAQAAQSPLMQVCIDHSLQTIATLSSGSLIAFWDIESMKKPKNSTDDQDADYNKKRKRTKAKKKRVYVHDNSFFENL